MGRVENKHSRMDRVEVYAKELSRRYHLDEISFSEAVEMLVDYEHWREADWHDPSWGPNENRVIPRLMIQPKPRPR